MTILVGPSSAECPKLMNTSTRGRCAAALVTSLKGYQKFVFISFCSRKFETIFYVKVGETRGDSPYAATFCVTALAYIIYKQRERTRNVIEKHEHPIRPTRTSLRLAGDPQFSENLHISGTLSRTLSPQLLFRLY